jgi:hypothetical protein
VVVAGAVAALVAFALGAALGSEARVSCRPALVPAYVEPAALRALAGRPASAELVVVNPASGPGERPDPAYRAAVRALQRRGSRVLGYVATDYGRRGRAAVQADVERFAAWYGVDGIFLDEAAAGEELLAHYAALARHARATGPRLVVLNPGVVPARGYLDLADVVVTFEGAYRDYAPALARMPRLAPERTAHLVYAATPEQAARVAEQAAAGHLYATPGALPNPWGELPAQLAPGCA